MQANARLMPNQACKEKGKRRIGIPNFLKGQADKGNIPKIACTYDDATGKFVSSNPPPPYEHPLQTPQGDEPKINTDFQEALQRCEDLQILTRLNINVQNCSWKDVFAQMTKANLDFQKQGEGLKYSMTRLWRAMGRGAENAKPWIELIPGDMGLDTLKAGLALCFSVRADARTTYAQQTDEVSACAKLIREECQNPECVRRDSLHHHQSRDNEAEFSGRRASQIALYPIV
jgi:hypothetical protein